MKLSTLSAVLAAGTILVLGSVEAVSAYPKGVDKAYAKRYQKYHKQPVLNSDFNHRYRYYHGHFPKTEDGVYADHYQKRYHKSVLNTDYNHRYRYYHGHYPNSTKR